VLNAGRTPGSTTVDLGNASVAQYVRRTGCEEALCRTEPAVVDWENLERLRQAIGRLRRRHLSS
jgi:hypothetical protein